MRAFSTIYHGNNAPKLDSYSKFVKYALDLDSKSSECYWKTQLSGARRALFPLPMGGISVLKSEKNMGISSRNINISRLTNSSITKATYLRAAWAILLARYCDTDDICFGASVSGRNAPSVENVVGLVVSTLPIRVRLDPDQNLAEFLHDIQKQATDMVAHEQFGLQKIAQISPDAKDACNFSSLLVIQPRELISNSEEDGAILVSTRVEQRLAWQSMSDYSSYPLVVQCHMDNVTVELELVYDTGVISEFQIQALHNQLDHVVQQLVSSSEEKVLSNVSIAGPWDLQQAMDWNAHDIVVEQDCLHDAVSRQAELCPDDEALYSTEFSLTYASLERLSNRVAYQLLQSGIQPETIVPFCMEKSVWTVVAMVGILKAGGAFMPLDPSHPGARRSALVKEVNASVMICSPSTAKSCEGMAEGIIQVSASLLSLPSGTPTNHQALRNYKQPKPHNSAYVIYTSGSTGKPKGIVMPHSAICTALFRQPKVVNITKTSRVFQFSSYAFDGCVVDIFAALITGATVCVPTDTERLSSTSQFMTQARVTWASLTPSFIKTIDPGTIPTLITLCAAGEVPTKDILTTWHGRVELFNLYGPAETCVMCSAHCWKSPNESPMTAGRPYAHRLFIAEPDNINRLAPIGCIGELVVEGHAIARGYINNEEKTNASFVKYLEWMLPTGSTRAYRTGDLAKFNSDGTIQFIGRRDTQVKLRGQRIELGEIEHRIMSDLEGVQYAAADVVEREAGKMLVAFVTFQNQPRPAATGALTLDDYFIKDETVTESFQALVQNLRQALPSYMIPSVIFPLWDMPHNTSQKIDRRMLRELVADMSQETLSKFSINKRDKTLPTTELEFRLRNLWARIVKVDPESISKFDSFLEVGGDSISAIFLSNLAAKEGLILPIVNIFKDPRLASMA
ncbi:non-ribosomal peptide synthetase, partial [Trichoderma atroviride IMI 206040]